MKELTLNESISNSISEKLNSAGYSPNAMKVCVSFSKGLGDKVYLTYSRNIIRTSKNTDGEKIITEIFGVPNGKASASQDLTYSSWFFNGYTGKSGSKVC